MTGEAHWFPVLLVVLGGVAIFGGGWFLSRARYRREQRRVVCPSLSKTVDCTLVQNVGSGVWTDVAYCSVFERAATCKKECLEALNRG